ncbi:hypothetical protein RLJV_23510 [Pseudomonas aeruginosa]|nr:hypothetical protein RLJV_23510 [Pseudomonas aeruginosa]
MIFSVLSSGAALSGGAGASAARRRRRARATVLSLARISSAYQLVEEGQAVHSRHFHVEADHVRRVLLDQVAGDEGVRRAADQAQLRVG